MENGSNKVSLLSRIFGRITKPYVERLIKERASEIVYQQTTRTENIFNQQINNMENAFNQQMNNMENAFNQMENAFNEQFSRIEGRMASDDKTTNAISLKLDDVAILAHGLLKRIENLENDMRHVSDKAVFACSQLEKLNSMGIDLFAEPAFNMLDKKTNSQAGEDSILAYITAVLGIPFSKCTYLDLGANHAKEMSNTFFFYSQGAKGVLVEANPELIPELRLYRHRDVVLNRCVDSVPDKTIDFYIFNIDGLSTPNKDDIDTLLKENKNLQLKETVPIKSITVNQIFEDYFEEPPVIMSVDVEGKDLEILQSIDFNKWRPLLIICEVIPYSTDLVIANKNKDIIGFMEENDYAEFAFTGINSIFIDKSRASKKNMNGDTSL